MKRLGALWSRMRESLWFLPSALTFASALLAVAAVWVDQRLAGSPALVSAALVTGADGARGVLMTIAGSLITVTGVVFSITIVALQLASSQYTPRVLRSFRADRANQAVLGVFIATFTYALIVLGTVRSQAEDYDRFVPVIAVTVAVALSLVSIGFLIFFVHHIVRSIQAEVIIERVTAEAITVVDHLFPEQIGESADLDAAAAPPAEAGEVVPVTAAHGGYLQEVDDDALLDAAVAGGFTVHMRKHIGEFVLPGDPVAVIVPAGAGRVYVESVREAFVIGAERTNHQDVERGVIELTDIAVRALSPGINDPTTALVCIDRITEVLATLGTRRFPDLARTGPDGRLCLMARRVGFDHTVLLAFAQLRHHGADNPKVAERIARALRTLERRLPPGRRSAVRAELEELCAGIARISSLRDRERVLEAAQP